MRIFLYICNHMLLQKRNIAFRTMLALCLLAQVAFIVPHHHHGEGACINVLHCLAAQAPDAGCCGHDHGRQGHDADATHDHDTPDRGCAITHVTMPAPRTEERATAAPALAIDLLLPCESCFCDKCDEIYHSLLSGLIIREVPDERPAYAAIVPRTAPARGPSVTA